MNVSRALLTAMLFVAPYSMVIAEDGQKETPATETAKVEKAGILATAALPFVYVANKATNATDFVAGWTVNPILNKITSISFLNRFQSHVPTVGRVMVTTAALYAAYKAYEAYNTEDVDADDNDAIFFEESETN